jgi:hypothetical protein
MDLPEWQFNVWHLQFVNRNAVEGKINDHEFWNHANRSSRRLHGILKEIVFAYRVLLKISGEGDPI